MSEEQRTVYQLRETHPWRGKGRERERGERRDRREREEREREREEGRKNMGKRVGNTEGKYGDLGNHINDDTIQNEESL